MLQKRIFSHIQRMGAVNALCLSKDQTHVVSVGQEKRMTYWDINATNPVHAVSLDGENDEGKCIARSNDGTLLATGGSAGVLRVWRFDSSKCIAAVVAHSGTINCVSFTPDDRQVLTVGDDGCINVWCVYMDDS